jgi:3-hydroxyacyl-CoA dehydrogenase
VLKHRKPGSIFSTNTSGIPLASIAEGFPTEFRQHFLGTHFFNPPRYLHLLEMIPGPETLPAVRDHIADFSDRHLGKGVVPCKDTPNFIANRIGSFLGATVQNLTVEMGFTIEEVDALTGQLIGLPKSASYRLLDIVGLDIWAHVTKNLYDLVPGDPWRERFVLPPFFAQMIERGWLGDKRGQGFYKRTGKGDKKEILALDLNTLEYQPSKKARFTSIEGVRNIEDLPQRLRALMALTDRPARSCGGSSATWCCTRPAWCRRFPIASSRSTAPCAGATPTRSAPSSCGTRWASKKLSRACARSSATFRRTSRKCSATGAKSFYQAPERPPSAPRILRSARQFL